MKSPYDLVLAGGMVLDPASHRLEPMDIGVIDGRIAAIAPNLPTAGVRRLLDAGGAFVTPGLIDFHIHSYAGVNPYGFDADPICMASGVTTAVDAGSAGPVNFSGFKKLIVEPSHTRMLAFVCLAQHGIWRSPGELSDLRFADPEGAAQTVAENPGVAVGIKVRLHRQNVGEQGREALRLAIEAAEACHSPVMVHIGDTLLSIEEIVDTLRPGDVVTHCFTPLQPSIVDETGHVRPAVKRARERGVIFDVGHANRHFSFDLVRNALADGLQPDIISTDLHTQAGIQPVVDLPTTMTKFMALGMRLEQVVAACTVNPARIMGWSDRAGAIAVGREADLAVIEAIEGQTVLQDAVGGKLTSECHISARWTIRAGEVFPDSA